MLPMCVVVVVFDGVHLCPLAELALDRVGFGCAGVGCRQSCASARGGKYCSPRPEALMLRRGGISSEL